MSANALFLSRMDVAHDVEPLFNEVYDTEHLPTIRKVPGVLRAARFRNLCATEPRYLAAYELTGVAVVDTPEWKGAAQVGRWPADVRPHTMNRHLVLYRRVGGAPALTWSTSHVFWALMDVEAHRDALFNQLYDAEEIPALLKDWKCVSVVRYRTDASGEPCYLTACEVEDADAPGEGLWRDAARNDRWGSQVLPYVHNRKFMLTKRL